jgi:hypothetical protein
VSLENASVQLISPQDENRPICMRCQTGGRDCTGGKDITFVEATIVKSRRTEKRVHISTRDTDLVYCPLPLSASLASSEFEICACYARKSLSGGGAVAVALQGLQLGDIIRSGTTATGGQIFHQAFMSFALVMFGSQHKQEHITGKGYAIHGRVLGQLNQRLSDSKYRTRDEVFLSVVTLALLECIVPTGPKHYINHMVAMERLLELRGPSPKSSRLYKNVRHMMLFASLRTGKPSILARREWKRLLRTQCSEDELQEEDLWDILADCTVLFAGRDKMLTNWDLGCGRSSHQRDNIKRKALTQLSHLHAWKERWDNDRRNCYSEVSVAPATLPTIEKSLEDGLLPFLTTFEFPNASAAILLMFYNTTLIYVLRILASVPVSFENTGLHSNQSVQDTLQDVGHVEDDYLAAERVAALEIFRCVPYGLFQRSRLDTCGSPLFHWTVTTAWMTLRGIESVEGRWMVNLLNANGREAIVKGLWV